MKAYCVQVQLVSIESQEPQQLSTLSFIATTHLLPCLKFLLTIVNLLVTKQMLNKYLDMSDNIYVLSMDVYLCVLFLVYCYATKEKSISHL
jgi:hypothetical protein